MPVRGDASAAARCAETVLARGVQRLGQSTLELEDKLAQMHGVRHCVTTTNAVSAFATLMYAWAISDGDAIFTCGFENPAFFAFIKSVRTMPVFYDCDRSTFTASAESLEKTITRSIATKKTFPRVAVVPHTFGYPCDIEEMVRICNTYGVLLLEYAGDALGAKYGSQPVGSFGDAGIISLHAPSAYASLCGCGAILTNDDELDETLRTVRAMGFGPAHSENMSRDLVQNAVDTAIDELTAEIILCTALSQGEDEIARRCEIAKRYRANITRKGILLPRAVENSSEAPYIFPVILPDNDAMTECVKTLRENGIDARGIYRHAVHRMIPARPLCWPETALPVSTQISTCGALLPIHSGMTDEQVDFICELINRE